MSTIKSIVKIEKEVVGGCVGGHCYFDNRKLSKFVLFDI